MFKKILNFFKGSGPRFPDTMPADFKIEIMGGGTFIRGSTHISIAENRLSINTDSKHQKLEYQTTSFRRTYLEKLFHLLKENGFDKIRIKETLRYDYPSFGINIFWGDKNTYKGESQTMEMSGDDYEIYHRCRFYIDRILEESLREETRTIQVVPDGRLLDKMQGIFQLNSAGSLYWYCYYNAKYISPNDSDQKNEFPNQLTVLPGYTTLNIYWKSDPHHEFARPKYVIQVPHDKDYERMYINVEGEKLTWRFE